MSKLLGIYEMGYERVEVRYDTGTASSQVTLLPKGKNTMVMTIGVKQGRWYKVLSGLMHEALEISLDRHHSRWVLGVDMSEDTGACLFVCDHATFADAVAVSADLISACQLDLNKAWRASRKKVKGVK